MKKVVVISFLLLTAGASFAAVEASRRSALLSSGTVLNPYTLQVVSTTSLTNNTSTGSIGDSGATPTIPIDDGDTGIDVRPGPFTPPPRSPYAPPPR